MFHGSRLTVVNDGNEQEPCDHCLRLAVLSRLAGRADVHQHRHGDECLAIIEDHNFLLMLQNKPEMEFPRAFWALDRRNPLSPWWHMLCRNILVSKDGYGFFAIRKFTDLFLRAVSTCS